LNWNDRSSFTSEYVTVNGVRPHRHYLVEEQPEAVLAHLAEHLPQPS
jgi:hypothetical protein